MYDNTNKSTETLTCLCSIIYNSKKSCKQSQNPRMGNLAPWRYMQMPKRALLNRKMVIAIVKWEKKRLEQFIFCHPILFLHVYIFSISAFYMYIPSVISQFKKMFSFLFVSEECLVRTYAVTIGKIIEDIEMLVLVDKVTDG